MQEKVKKSDKKPKIRTECRAGALFPLATDLHKLATKVLGKKGFLSVDLIARWPDVVGENMAAYVKPEKISFPKGERTSGTLYVKVQSGAVALTVEHQKNVILGRVASFMGLGVVTDLKVIQDASVRPSPPASSSSLVSDKPKELTTDQQEKLAQMLASVKDKALREKLEKIGKSIFLK